MKPLPLMIALVSLGLVGAVVVYEWNALTSPGALHPSHLSVPELQGSKGCAACHGVKGQSMADACAACHQDVAAQFSAGEGIHGSLGATGRRCASCHTEHADGRVRLVSEASFENARISPAASYDHRFVPDFDLHGAHDKLMCEQCHVHAHARSLDRGQKRYLGLARDCRVCHEDTHRGEFGADCVSCHGQVHAFKDAAEFRHASGFALEGAHAGLECSRCHEKSGARSVASLLTSPLPVRACVSCHEDAHGGSLGQDCASCHGTMLPFNQAAEYRHTALFPLAGGHAGLACKACHEPEGPRSVPSLQVSPLPVRECADCHDSPHSGALVRLAAATAGASEQASCAVCHSTQEGSFLGTAARMTPSLHKATGFALEAPHDAAECAQCHADFGKREPVAAGPGLAQRFGAFYPGRSASDCAACHQDPHRGQFDSGATGGRCIECHAATHFTPSGFDIAHHDRSRFPLTGSHKAVACALCHREVDGERGFVPTPMRCAECHTDVHGGVFDAKGRPAAVDGKDGCARCHTTSRFAEVTWDGAAHALWTGYELKGAHGAAACADCHTRRAAPDERGRTLGAAPTRCNDCHTDPHSGQFRRAGVTDCARCHTEAAFAPTMFDHNRDSAFTLDETHMALECAACHKPFPVADGRPVVRYRPLGSRCQDCHDPGMLRAREQRP